MDTLKFALWYGRKFGAVIPVGAWTFKSNSGEDVDMWKCALIKNWSREPLRTEAQIRGAWGKWNYWGRDPQIAIATGQICGGYIVIDLDKKPERGVDGYEVLLEWQRENGIELPDTWRVLTGSGGLHLWYRTPLAMRSYANTELGVDLRADGGYIMAPPSLHPSGKRYQWEVGYSPREIECAEADQAVLAFIDYCTPAGSEWQDSNGILRGERREDGGERKARFLRTIEKGHRHKSLVSLCGTLNRLGISDEGIELLVRHENAVKCSPPMTEEELQREIFSAIYTFPKGVRAEAWIKEEQYLQKLKAAQQQARREELRRQMM